ncbi:hypothetical protein SynWH8101_0257 [Synechococcus sp. WH 8101]|nr:hypothetical protein SynWH8101_0257 [Synechococcus sp. WH 8101]QNI44066.1 hypothetical protein SynRCC2555_00258 [Synechococcus sp. WH 8101]
MALSSASRSFSLSICEISLLSRYGFAGLRLHPLLVRDLSQLVVDNGSPIQRRQQAPEPRQGGVVLRFAD